jgi:asparagine synthase (glutamine-hydrolysing)
VIPDELIDRPKQGFGVPIHEWFLDRLGSETRRTLDEFCRDTDLLDRDEVLAIVDQKRAVESWYLLNLALWHKEYIA